MKKILILLTLGLGIISTHSASAQTKSGFVALQQTAAPTNVITGYPCLIEVTRLGKIWISLYSDSYCYGTWKGTAVIEREDWSGTLREPWDWDGFNKILETIISNRWSSFSLLFTDFNGVKYVSSVTLK